MKCTVYRSRKKEFTYIYLREGFSFEELPAELQRLVGAHDEVLSLELGPKRALAQEDVATVIRNLATSGYHLQLPPREDPGGWLDLPKEILK